MRSPKFPQFAGKGAKKHFSKAEQDNCPMITIKHSSVVGVVLAAVAATSAARTDDQRPVVNTLREVYSALRACWSPPPLAELRGRLELSVRLSFRGNGEILGEPFITFETPNVSEEERLAYRISVARALQKCTPLRFGNGLGGAIAGRPINLRFAEERPKQKI